MLIKNEMKLLFIEGKKRINLKQTNEAAGASVPGTMLDAIIPPTSVLQVTFSLLEEETEPQRLRAFPHSSKLLTAYE